MRPESKMEIPEMEKFLEKYELRRFRSDLVGRVVTLIIASLGLIAALAWDSALKHIFEELFGGGGTIAEEVSYAVVITTLAVIISISLGRLFRERRDKNEK